MSTPAALPESPLLVELKTRARLRLNSRKADANDADAQNPDAQSERPALRLRDCLNMVSREAGFAHWEQARHVLGGQAVPGDDMGSFWHAPRCQSLLNAWYASHAEACAGLAAAAQARPGVVLLPYRRQFVVADAPYLRELGLDPLDPLWAAVRHDLVRSYGSASWQALAWRRLKAPRETYPVK